MQAYVADMSGGREDTGTLPPVQPAQKNLSKADPVGKLKRIVRREESINWREVLVFGLKTWLGYMGIGCLLLMLVMPFVDSEELGGPVPVAGFAVCWLISLIGVYAMYENWEIYAKDALVFVVVTYGLMLASGLVVAFLCFWWAPGLIIVWAIGALTIAPGLAYKLCEGL